MADKDKDELSGVETTGHEWDGLKELNTPLPRWWLYVFYATVLWAIGYWIIYPAWPFLNGYTKGVIGYSSRGELTETMARVEKGRSTWKGRFEAASVSDIIKDAELFTYAQAGGRAIFADNCAPCHAAGGSGSTGYPSLADDDWIWGGDVESIYTTVRFGARGIHEETRVGDMPAFGTDEILNQKQITAVSDYVLSLSSGPKAGEGKRIFAEQCASCHGEAGTGNKELGAPNLADAIWLYGSSAKDIMTQISRPKHGVMPSWEGRLDSVSLKQVSIYVHALGGGQ